MAMDYGDGDNLINYRIHKSNACPSSYLQLTQKIACTACSDSLYGEQAWTLTFDMLDTTAYSMSFRIVWIRSCLAPLSIQ